MASVGQVIKKAREGYGYSIRELGRRANVSAAQLSRIEAGKVDQPALDTLLSVARALDRNPKPLLIAAGHIRTEEAKSVLAALFDSDSELVEEWSYGWQDRLDAARKLLAKPNPDERALRGLAGDVFLTAETEETLWWDSWLGPLLEQEGGNELRSLVGYWQVLPSSRRQKVIEYAREQAELARPERLGLTRRKGESK
jgi:transcriptional regulator with XRE-family HTH domain